MKILYNLITYIFILLFIIVIFWLINSNFNNKQMNNVNDLYNNYIKNQFYYIGVQHSRRIKYSDVVSKFSKIQLNNIADPYKPPSIDVDPNTYNLEKKYLEKYASWINMDLNNMWGITTSCGSEGCLYGIVYGKKHFDKLKPIVLTSKKSHYVIERYSKMFNLEIIMCNVNKYDELDMTCFESTIIKNSEKFKKNGIIVVLTIGTTIKCGYDNISESVTILKKHNMNYYLHLDAALGGFIVPFLENNPINYKKTNFDSISVSPYKMLGMPYPSGFFITTLDNKLHNQSEYTSKDDGSLFCSRNGQSVLYIYLYLCMNNSFNECKEDVISCLNLKQYVIKKLQNFNIKYGENPNNGLTIYFKKETMNDALIKKYHLITDNIYSHIYIMPGAKKSVLDSFISDYYNYINKK